MGRVTTYPARYSTIDVDFERDDEIYCEIDEHDFIDNKKIYAQVTQNSRAILHQTRYWIDKNGKTHEVSNIDSRYARNILRYLSGFQTTLHRGAWAAGLANYSEAPSDWLARQPLVIALQERVDAGD